jgi:hypothetical protein
MRTISDIRRLWKWRKLGGACYGQRGAVQNAPKEVHANAHERRFPFIQVSPYRVKNHAERGISWLSPTQAREDSRHRIEPAICALHVDHFL